MTEELESDVQDMDRWLKQQLRPDDDAVERVWHRVDAGRGAPANGHSGRVTRTLPRRTVIWAAAAAAAVVVLSLGAALVGSRLQAPDRFATTVLPPQSTQSTSAGAGPAAFGQLGADRAPASAAAAAPYSPTFYGGSCSQAPAVQLQGRGVTATGFAALSTTGTGSQVGLTVQGQGSDANAAAAAAQSKASAVEAALTKAGLAANQVQRTSFNVYSGPPNQATAAIYMQARVNDAADVNKVITAAVQAGATSAYSGNQVLTDSANDSEVQDAVTRATSQAKTMATSTASAAGVQIAQLQTVVAQPPQVCYGPSGPQRVVAVTVSYSLK